MPPRPRGSGGFNRRREDYETIRTGRHADTRHRGRRRELRLFGADGQGRPYPDILARGVRGDPRRVVVRVRGDGLHHAQARVADAQAPEELRVHADDAHQRRAAAVGDVPEPGRLPAEVHRYGERSRPPVPAPEVPDGEGRFGVDFGSVGIGDRRQDRQLRLRELPGSPVVHRRGVRYGVRGGGAGDPAGQGRTRQGRTDFDVLRPWERVPSG